MNKASPQPVFTIGHSLHSSERFFELLAMHNIGVLLDVRSSPFSRRAPQFGRPELVASSRQAGIRYSFGGLSLGGRPTEPAFYDNGRANYERMASAPAFRTGIRRIATAAKASRVALLCAEADPIECHRFLLIGRVLSKFVDVQHILASGQVEPHRRAEERMLAAVGLAQPGLFEGGSNALETAYSAQSARMAYTKPSAESDSLWSEAI